MPKRRASEVARDYWGVLCRVAYVLGWVALGILALHVFFAYCAG
jgi:hypothetical protein